MKRKDHQLVQQVLDGEIEPAEPQSIAGMGIALTICGGRVTHSAPGWG